MAANFLAGNFLKMADTSVVVYYIYKLFNKCYGNELYKKCFFLNLTFQNGGALHLDECITMLN